MTEIIILVCLIICSAYFSATETAFSSLNKTKLRAMTEKGNKRAKLTLAMAEDYDKLLSTILIGNNIVNIAAASIATVLFVRLYPDMGATVSTAVMTVVVLVFGEVTPKGIAKDMPEKFAMFSAPLLRVLIWIFTPLNFLFGLWKKLISKLFRLKGDTKMSQDELLMLVEEVQQDGSIDEDEGDLLRNAIEFTERSAEDILTHRVDLVAAEAGCTKEELADLFTQSKFSRIPVYEGSIDNIIGVVHLKNLYEGVGVTDKPLREILSPAVFVSQNAKIDDILEQLQREKSQVAVVLDEYGGTYGIITMEDILEELVGEIYDEHDEVEDPIREIGDHTYQVDAAVDMHTFCEYFDCKIETESVSLGSWIMEQNGEFPQVGDTVTYGTMTITVKSLDYHRVEYAEVYAPQTETEEEKEPAL